jgi:hypothetical protein
VVTGILAGLIAYAAVLLPVIVVTAPSDVTVEESLGAALFFGVPLGLAVMIGSMIGSGIGTTYRTTFGRRRSRQKPTGAS